MLNIIWNITRNCPWNCSFCCVNAIYKKDQDVGENINEMSLEEKKKFISSLVPGEYKIDFSGGEIFSNPQNIDIIKEASLKLGKENIGISTSGAFLNEEIISDLSNYISDVEFTMDVPPNVTYLYRPNFYHETADYAIKLFKKYHVKVGIQTVLTKENTSLSNLNELNEYIKKNKIDTWSLLKFFPSGRGKAFNHIAISDLDLETVIENIITLSKEENYDLDIQYVLPKTTKDKLCRAVKKSIGILPTGEVISCFWALNENMTPIDSLYSLGNLNKQTIQEILNNENSKYWKHQQSCLLCQG